MQPQDVRPVPEEPEQPEADIIPVPRQEENDTAPNPFDDLGLAPGVRKSNAINCHLITIFFHTQTFSP